MTKAELVEALASNSGLSEHAVKLIVNDLARIVGLKLAQGQYVKVDGLGVFSSKVFKARNGMNPRTRVVIRIPARVVPVFDASKELKDRVW